MGWCTSEQKVGWWTGMGETVMTTRARPVVLKTLGFQNVLIQEEQRRCFWNVLILRGGIQKNTTFASRMSPVILYQLQSIELGVPCPQIGHCVQLRCSHDAVVVKTMMMMMSKKESLKSSEYTMSTCQVSRFGFWSVSKLSPKLILCISWYWKHLGADDRLPDQSQHNSHKTFRQACSPLIQLFFEFSSDIDQTNINSDIRDGNWLSKNFQI